MSLAAILQYFLKTYELEKLSTHMTKKTRYLLKLQKPGVDRLQRDFGVRVSEERIAAPELTIALHVKELQHPYHLPRLLRVHHAVLLKWATPREGLPSGPRNLLRRKDL